MTNIIKIAAPILIVVVLFGLLYLGGSYLFTDIHNNADPSQTALKAPYFDLPRALDGRLKLSDFSDTPLIILFWTTWNQSSADQLKILDDFIFSESAKRGSLVKVVAINSQEDASTVNSFIRRGDYKTPVALDVEGSITEDYKVRGLPSFFFVDREGFLRASFIGILSEKEIVDKIEEILN